MHISFSPQRRDDALTLEKTGDVLTVNGEQFNFNGLADGDTIKREDIPGEWFAGDVTKTGGEVYIVLTLPHGPRPSRAVAFPDPIVGTEDGPIAVPQDEPPVEETANVDA
ncbi:MULTISPECIES: hypothetical protein [unclassified Mesorhizobium]|uniref:hypothetical protein n=1 Tax=unclassified Mesorhizobium TaxID=325217 RepID=UPI00112DEFE3|nr:MULTISPECIES: hypothetical protein [unclassified Mesorhizobium]MCA0027327.1 hypothetical protein [Mesorhizobium sp. B263B1A]TPJ98602.1 hypothetical protein FJ489_06655 [Mesorhizobium sp. B2-5-12]TPK28764.1 hypothetical protein FJ562_00045 [Mesorhizobium sp. B2-5-6]